VDAGWTRWLLEHYEFPYQIVRDADVRAGKLNDRFDAIVLADIPKRSLIDGITNTWTRPEHRGGLGKEGVAALKGFVVAGGTLMTFGNSSAAAGRGVLAASQECAKGAPAGPVLLPRIDPPRLR